MHRIRKLWRRKRSKTEKTMINEVWRQYDSSEDQEQEQEEKKHDQDRETDADT